MSGEREIDAVTGAETTGHEWDGIKELNKPLPRWWLYTFYVCILWSVGYWIIYPAWPTLTGYTKGTLGYSQRATLSAEIDAARAGQAHLRSRIASLSLADIRSDSTLQPFASAGGAASFQTNCAPCHGRGAQGFVSFPNLNDDDWLWGGRLEDIYKTIQFGIRNGHKQARDIQMPRYGTDKLLTPEQISDVAAYVLTLSAQPSLSPSSSPSSSSADAAAATRGAVTFKEQCSTCHGDDGRGKLDQGAPNLADGIWLYGGTRQAVVESISTGRGGAMPAWIDRLDDVAIKSLTIYVHSLGGGK